MLIFVCSVVWVVLSVYTGKNTKKPVDQSTGFSMATVDNNDTVSYGCIMVALELQPYERKMQPSKKSSTNWNISNSLIVPVIIQIVPMLQPALMRSLLYNTHFHNVRTYPFFVV